MLSFRSKRSRQFLATLSAVTVALATAVTTAGAATNFNLVVSGSTTVCPVATNLVAGFQSQYGDTTIVGPTGTAGVDCPGSGTGIKNLLNGTTDVADASRPEAGSDTGTTFTPAQTDQWPIALDGISIIVNSSVPSVITNLTVSQIKGIYGCTITNWSQINSSASGVIAPFSRTSASGTYGDFNKFIGGSSFAPNTACVTFASPDSNPGMLSNTQGNVNGLAYVGLGFAYTNDVPTSGIRILQVDGITPSPPSTVSGNSIVTAIDNLTCVPPSGHTTCGSLFPFGQAPAPDTVGPCTDPNPCTTVAPGSYPFGRQLFMDTIKPTALVAGSTRAANYARAIQWVNNALIGNPGAQAVLTEGFVGLTTPSATSDPGPVDLKGDAFNNACVSQTNGHFCPQIIPPWDVNLEGITNIDAVAQVGLDWNKTAPAGDKGGWIRSDLVFEGVVNIDAVGKIGNHWNESWTRWKD